MFRILIMSLLASLFLTQTGWSTSSCGLEENIDRWMQPYSGSQRGAVVLVMKDGQPVFKKGYGKAHRRDRIPVNTDSVFRLASVSKQFTALAIAMLVDRGQLSFQTKLEEIYPKIPAYAGQITIEQLLTHTSGLPNYTKIKGRSLDDADVLQMVKSRRRGLFSPGRRYKYSNTGYAVLAEIIGEVSGKSFEEFMRTEVFDPLNMPASSAGESYRNENQRAYGFGKPGYGSDQGKFSRILGDGGIYSSANDMIQWNRFFKPDNSPNPLISDRSVWKKIFKRGRLGNGQRIGYAKGLRVDRHLGQKRIHHSGSSIGFRNFMAQYPDSDFSVMVLTNDRLKKPKAIVTQIAEKYVNRNCLKRLAEQSRIEAGGAPAPLLGHQ